MIADSSEADVTAYSSWNKQGMTRLARRAYRAIANAADPVIPIGLRTAAHYWSRRATHRLEREYQLAMGLVGGDATVADVGANVGLYTYGFARRARTVHAFEPIPTCAAQVTAMTKLSRTLGFLPGSPQGTVHVHNVALADREGRLELRIPLRCGRADTEAATLVGAVDVTATADREHCLEVEVRTLDSFHLTGLSLVKIDVEGYELTVLRGSRETIERERPMLLMEIEQRHHHGVAITDVFAEIETYGYSGEWLDAADKLRPIGEFDEARDQSSANLGAASAAYVNNFLFRPL